MRFLLGSSCKDYCSSACPDIIAVSLPGNQCRQAQILHCLLLSRGLLLCRDLFEETDSIDSAAVAPPSRLARGGKSAYKLNSVGARFRKQLHGLMGTLNQCQPHYIRSVSHTGLSVTPGSCGRNYQYMKLPTDVMYMGLQLQLSPVGSLSPMHGQNLLFQCLSYLGFIPFTCSCRRVHLFCAVVLTAQHASGLQT